MASLTRNLTSYSCVLRGYLPRLYSTGTKGGDQDPSKEKKPAKKETVAKAKEPKTEPFDNSEYKSIEYYQYNDLSYYDIDNDMSEFRLPQQSKFVPA
ncbi:NADH dehydrogenase [ubiquinone] flavoprotein 3, mitochondrial-like [Mytilus californianus]|uniref:NADH dehydrogenase [ubiquinone] flavoprotein 3, mitochondrial-like n=1 Tax=Mytilus californianus TaxID=6549 RepID=UPI0022452DD2|nr:NADH dehydrogenase [ubiquinone] flavoprotein 3, mitochondrial-like [Mytilus californianus]